MAMLTLFSSISGGSEWALVADPLALKTGGSRLAVCFEGSPSDVDCLSALSQVSGRLAARKRQSCLEGWA